MLMQNPYIEYSEEESVILSETHIPPINIGREVLQVEVLGLIMTDKVSADNVAIAGIVYAEITMGILFSGSVGIGRT